MRLFGYLQTLWRRSDDEIEFLWQNHDWDVNPFFLHFMLLSVKVNLTIFSPIFLLPFFQFLLSSSQAWQMRVLSNVFWWLIERWWWRKKSLSSLIKINFWKIDWKVGFFDHFLNLISDQCVGFLKRAWGYCFH